MQKIDLTVQGFKAGAVKAGIRRPGRFDLGLIYSERPAAAAGVFTRNRVKAAPVILDIANLRHGKAQAILINSGVANACTGDDGLNLARATGRLAAEALDIPPASVLVASTGVIGEALDLGKFEQNMPQLVASLNHEGLAMVAKAIMTTDTVPKTAARQISIDGHPVKIAGVAKGAGMIMPNMATMLCFLLTDLNIHDAAALQGMLKKSVDRSFNRITVDGDTSTNDSVIIMAGGAAGNPVTDDYGEGTFQEALNDLTMDLARQIVADGEGATKAITVRVIGAADEQQALTAARTIANSSLVKTAFFGEDANWGRIIAALGRSGAYFDPSGVDISFDNATLVRNGVGMGMEIESQAGLVLKQKKFSVTVDLKSGPGSAEIYTTDLSIDYVKINADYRS